MYRYFSAVISWFPTLSLPPREPHERTIGFIRQSSTTVGMGEGGACALDLVVEIVRGVSRACAEGCFLVFLVGVDDLQGPVEV